MRKYLFLGFLLMIGMNGCVSTSYKCYQGYDRTGGAHYIKAQTKKEAEQKVTAFYKSIGYRPSGAIRCYNQNGTTRTYTNPYQRKQTRGERAAVRAYMNSVNNLFGGRY